MLDSSNYGGRVEVYSADQRINLGLGTHLGEEYIHNLGLSSPRLLLDTGESIYGYECWWRKSVTTPFPPFPYVTEKPARLFRPEGKGILLVKAGLGLPADTEVTVEHFELRDYDHRPLVAAYITFQRMGYYLLAEEMEFPRFGE